MSAIQYIEIAIIVLAVLAFIMYVIWQIKKIGLRETAIKFIVKAEDMYRKGDNEKKINYVIDKIIVLIPAPLSFFITREAVRNFIQTIFDETKKALDYVPKKEG
jgi:hypothetical protein